MTDTPGRLSLFREERAAWGALAAVVAGGIALGAYARLPPAGSERDEGERFVTVSGAVERPGKYLPARGRSAREAAVAAGASGDADHEWLDATVPLAGREAVYVPRRGEPPLDRERRREEVLRRERRPRPLVRADINAAGAEELARLPGVGPKLAEAIVLERRRGRFAGVGDLRRVSGMGERKIERLREYLLAGR